MTSKSDIAVSVRGLSKSYSIAKNAAQHTTAGEALMHKLRNPFAKPERETFWALNDVSFDIQKGDVVGIIGRNGAGKSTLLKILSRITEPTQGRIDLYGRVGSLLEVGTGFHPELTGRENIFLNGAILGMSKAEITRQFDAIVDFSGTEQFLDTPVKRYSSGMYVRLAFAVAAHLNPEILIVDEVLAVGDAEFQKKCLGKMKDVAESGRTVLFVSHSMTAVRTLCERGILLEEGRVYLTGAADDCADAYAGNLVVSDGTIINSGIKKTHHIDVDKITLNASEENTFVLSSRMKQIFVDLHGIVNEAVPVNIEIRLSDSSANLVGICSPAYLNGDTATLSPGRFHIRTIVEMPKLIRGNYTASINLYNPGIATLWEFSNAITISVEGWPTLTGLVFDKSMNVGSIMLDGRTCY